MGASPGGRLGRGDRVRRVGLPVDAGIAGYRGGFVEHYIIPLLYPAGLTPPKQAALGTFVLVVNLFAYGVVVRRMLRGT